MDANIDIAVSEWESERKGVSPLRTNHPRVLRRMAIVDRIQRDIIIELDDGTVIAGYRDGDKCIGAYREISRAV